MITEYLQKDNLIICPNSLKKNVVREINEYSKLVSYKIMDLKTFIQNYFFSYNKMTIYYLMNKLGLKYELVLEYLDSLYFLEDKEYLSQKLNDLNKIKRDLIDKKLLEYNSFFQDYLLHTNIIVYGYENLDLFYQNIFSNYDNFIHVKKQNSIKKHTVYEFDNIEDEIAYICDDIKKKLDLGISIQHIKLITPSSEYINPLKRIFSWCHLPLQLESKISLYDIEIGKKVLKSISNNMPFSDIVEEFKQQGLASDIFNIIVSIFNDYVDFDIEENELYSMIEYDLKNTYLPNKQKENCINICDFNQVNKDDYIYLLGFNKENYPTLYKDEDFLSDNMKQELGLFNSNQKNINSMNALKNNLNHDTNLTITYKLKDAFNSYNPCILAKEEYQVIKNPEISFQISHFYNQIMLAKKYDEFYKYGSLHNDLKRLSYHYPNLSYRTYQNQFTGIDKEEFISSLKQPFTISYSTIDEFYRCGFRYYVSNILKIREENIDEFYMNIGNIFHYVLSKCFDSDFDFEKSWNEEASKYEFKLNQLVLLEKLKQELKYDIEIIHKHQNYSYFDKYLLEKKFSVPIKNDKNIPVNFVGFVDKISYLQQENHTLVSVIDYKTGHLPSNLNNIIYGIGMQLPIYLYFIKRSSLFPNLKIVGFYLQKIINKEMKATSGKTIDELKENALKLVGYSTDNEEILRKFDMTYEDSQMISGLKKKKEGFYAYSKILNDKQIEKMDEIVESRIKEATNDILKADFRINPKKIDKDLVGCEFCSYRDLCYKTEKDYVELEKHKDLDFLGGDDNA